MHGQRSCLVALLAGLWSRDPVSMADEQAGKNAALARVNERIEALVSMYQPKCPDYAGHQVCAKISDVFRKNWACL